VVYQEMNESAESPVMEDSSDGVGKLVSRRWSQAYIVDAIEWSGICPFFLSSLVALLMIDSGEPFRRGVPLALKRRRS
jgi:hypothetical protein